MHVWGLDVGLERVCETAGCEVKSVSVNERSSNDTCGTVPNERTTAWQKCGAVARRPRIESCQIVVSLNSRLENDQEE